MMKLFYFVFFSIISFYGVTCNIENDDSIYPVLKDEGGYIIFDKNFFQENESNNYRISLKYMDCVNKKLLEINELDFYNSPGKISSAFIINNETEKKLFIIHSTTVNWQKVEPYGFMSDYFVISVYKKEGNKYILDNKASNYFGGGADLFDVNLQDNEPVYVYPYKHKDNIINSIQNYFYENFLTNDVFQAHTKEKVYLYEEPSIHFKTKNYLMAGEEIKILDINSGWAYLTYHNREKNNDYLGWVEIKFLQK